MFKTCKPQQWANCCVSYCCTTWHECPNITPLLPQGFFIAHFGMRACESLNTTISSELDPVKALVIEYGYRTLVLVCTVRNGFLQATSWPPQTKSFVRRYYCCMRMHTHWNQQIRHDSAFNEGGIIFKKVPPPPPINDLHGRRYHFEISSRSRHSWS